MTCNVDCLGCGKEMEDWDPRLCCSGRECGCMGQPTEPQVCSAECFDKVYMQNTLQSEVDVDSE